MASVCVSSCINDVRVPVRPTYINLYKWPESDAEFIRSVSSKPANPTPTRVVDSISCRQLYLRSYTFSREEDHSPPKNPKNCFPKLRFRRRRKTTAALTADHGGDKTINGKCSTLKKAKELSCAALTSVFRRLLLCTAEVDVADNVMRD